MLGNGEVRLKELVNLLGPRRQHRIPNAARHPLAQFGQQRRHQCRRPLVIRTSLASDEPLHGDPETLTQHP
eukprot:scaffold3946_cov118-Isochrysis_galbana.AAC.7